MRELDRPTTDADLPDRCAVVGRGRLGRAMARALGDGGLEVDGPLGRGADAIDAGLVLLCVPDGEIAAASACIAPGRLVGHCSGATGLDVVGHEQAFALHPLMTVTEQGARFEGAGCAVAGSTEGARRAATALAERLGMHPFTIAEEDRAAYHAAATMASNFLITLEAAAERVAASTGADRDLIVPLVRATVDNWASQGAQRALTGPLARGDEATVQRQRQAVAERAPELLDLFDVLSDATRALAVEGGPGVRTIRTVSELRQALAQPRRSGACIGLVPTMGAFHGGHRSLIRRARQEADVVVVSLFVNPAQFAGGEDLDGYPRDEATDAAVAAELGADILFAPSVEEVYPDGFATTVTVSRITEILEGAHRGAAHFRGVATVVTKLLNMVSPGIAYFGQKDAQQAVVIRRLVSDLDLGVEVVVCPTVREPDGLAMSSRNAYLDPEDRARAVALSRGLQAAESVVAAGEANANMVASAARAALAEYGVEPEYLEVVRPDTLSPLAVIDGDALVVVAATIGRARLIDNTTVRAPATLAGDLPEPVAVSEARCSA